MSSSRHCFSASFSWKGHSATVAAMSNRHYDVQGCVYGGSAKSVFQNEKQIKNVNRSSVVAGIAALLDVSGRWLSDFDLVSLLVPLSISKVLLVEGATLVVKGAVDFGGDLGDWPALHTLWLPIWPVDDLARLGARLPSGLLELH